MADMPWKTGLNRRKKPLDGLLRAFHDHSDRTVGFIPNPALETLGLGQCGRSPAKTDPLDAPMEDEFGANR